MSMPNTSEQAADWRDLAACRAVDPETFYPTAEHGRALARQESAAKAVCARCPVRDACLEWALTALPYGVAGGMTETERRSARRRQQVAKKPTRPVGGTRSEIAQAGRAALRSGSSPAEVASALGVSERTAYRWATALNSKAEGSRGGNRAPLLISHNSPQPGTHAEGHRG